MREPEPRQFIEKAIGDMLPILKRVFAENLRMVALYGSGATGSFVRGVSDINLLIIIAEPSVDQLLQLAKEGKKGLVDYRVTPHVLSEKELLTSSDVFPVEYQEIAATMRVLYGSSLFESLDIGKKNLRHQIESMLRGGLNSLKQIILLASNDDKIFRRELVSWSGRQIPLFRAVLRLYNAQSEGCSSLDLLKLVSCMEKQTGLSCTAFRQLLDLRDKRDAVIDLTALVTDLNGQYMSIVEAVDAREFED